MKPCALVFLYLVYISLCANGFYSHSGQALNGNSQQSSQQIPTQSFNQSTSVHSMEHGQDYSLLQPCIQTQLQAAGYCPVNQTLLAHGQDQYPTFPNASSHFELPNLSILVPSNNIRQVTMICIEELLFSIIRLWVCSQQKIVYGICVILRDNRTLCPDFSIVRYGVTKHMEWF